MTYTQAAKEFVPETAREQAVANKCKLRSATGSENGTCPCEHPKQCQIIKIISDEEEEDQE
jgi:hypothetical protein